MFLVKDEERGRRSALKCHWTTFLREPVCNYLSPEHLTYVQTHALHTSHHDMIQMKFCVLVLFKMLKISTKRYKREQILHHLESTESG